MSAHAGQDDTQGEVALPPLVSKAALLGRRLGEGDCVLTGVGTIRLRGLSRAEVLEVRKLNDAAEADRRMISLAFLAPVLTEDDVAVWQQNSSPGEIEEATSAIAEMSGMGAGAAKTAYRLFRS